MIPRERLFRKDHGWNPFSGIAIDKEKKICTLYLNAVYTVPQKNTCQVNSVEIFPRLISRA